MPEENGWVELPGGTYIPAPDLVWRHAPPGCKTLLDVGGGSGTVGESQWIKYGIETITVIDVWEGYRDKPWVRRLDARFALKQFGEAAFDVVQCCDMIEHVPKEVGRQLLEDFKQLARRFVVFTTPTGYTEQDPEKHPEEAWSRNPHQKHVCGWLPDEFLAAGYDVYMNGRNERGTYAGAYTHAMFTRGVK